MSNNWQQDVFDFMTKFNQPTPCDPCIPDEATLRLRKQLLLQELLETLTAMHHNDLPGIVDGIVDLIYVILGMAVSCGVDIAPIWNKIHAANMLKEPYSAERALELQMAGVTGIVPGKVLKPLGWRPVNVARCIQDQLLLRCKIEKILDIRN